MFTEEQIAEFNERGFIVGPKVITDDQADALREGMFDVLEGRSQRKPELNRNLQGDESKQVVNQIVNIWEADDRFEDLIYNEKLCSLAAQVVGHPTLRVWHDQIQYKPPHKGGMNDWHQDHPYWPIIQPADLVSAWIALDDATPENGCMSMVPGSHKWGPHKGGTVGTDRETFTPTPDLDQLPEGIAIDIAENPVPKGHVSFHHCLTWHGSPANDSDRGRPAIAIHYMPGYTRYEPGEDRTHMMGIRVEVEPGEELKGDYFPTVWENGPVDRAAGSI